MNDVWGNDEDYARKAAAKHRKARKRARRRAKHAAGGGCLLALVPLAAVSDEPTWKKIGCGTSLGLLWAAVLVPLILCC